MPFGGESRFGRHNRPAVLDSESPMRMAVEASALAESDKYTQGDHDSAQADEKNQTWEDTLAETHIQSIPARCDTTRPMRHLPV